MDLRSFGKPQSVGNTGAGDYDVEKDVLSAILIIEDHLKKDYHRKYEVKSNILRNFVF